MQKPWIFKSSPGNSYSAQNVYAIQKKIMTFLMKSRSSEASRKSTDSNRRPTHETSGPSHRDEGTKTVKTDEEMSILEYSLVVWGLCWQCTKRECDSESETESKASFKIHSNFNFKTRRSGNSESCSSQGANVWSSIVWLTVLCTSIASPSPISYTKRENTNAPYPCPTTLYVGK